MTYTVKDALAVPTYQMDIETQTGVTQHGYHLGTDFKIAERFALEEVRREGVVSVGLRLNNKLVQIYDWRDIQD